MGGPVGESRSWYGVMAMNVRGARSSEHAHIATKWHSVMNLAKKCAENVLPQ